MKDITIDIATILFSFIFIIGLVVLCTKCSKQESEAKYNNGYCPCGGHYEYVEAVGHRGTTTYIYSCDKCGHKIELSYLPD